MKEISRRSDLSRILSIFGLVIFGTFSVTGCGDSEADKRAERIKQYFSMEMRLPQIKTSYKVLAVNKKTIQSDINATKYTRCPKGEENLISFNMEQKEYLIPSKLIRDKEGKPYDAEISKKHYSVGTEKLRTICIEVNESNNTLVEKLVQRKTELLGFKSFDKIHTE